MQGMRIPRESPAGWLIEAPAKLNVYLDVLPRRPDGFHGIRTLLCPVRLSDTLCLRPDNALRGEVRLTIRSHHRSIDASQVPTDDRNLVTRALRGVWAARRLEAGCHVTIEKRIPSQAGLGGGSSDAAAAIVAANHLWDLRLTPEEALSVAAAVGSDVPGQLSGTANLCEGRGEQVTPAPIPAGVPCVIAKPAAGLSTAEVFSRCTPGEADGGSVTKLLAALRHGRWQKLPSLVSNQLQAAAMELCDELRMLAAAFHQFPFVAHQMTGSGAAYFGVCRSHQQALQAVAWLRARQAAWAVATCTA
ncbi:4-diphosphocytidyl-2-C-methyl-D-erythritol kinase [Posidoniimonas polymericola]|uniref:4-diphosphocytidyl-2-C-methyl-D-erythritol kinase n=1 Tax=Posidoniimonas polymericola TaxID=2528002 RepID=A0A5C5YU35_9BACT|nr:4-(cytidine 5'-diphospho)-2-C-methyl-D-erythritol kinase [Posidoniimonas polymericola]TWT78519.1 4-diphosphocytidyl-2-C-methyl-D-erythritol kinase [Posidoniimonas polymericola]